MTYEPPPGWTEAVPTKPGEPERNLSVFHAKSTCARIHDPRNLKRVDKPYSAARCSACASAG